MASMNKVFLAGNLTKEPELRSTPSGKAVAQFGLAVNDGFKDKTGAWKEQAVFVDVVVWDRPAENCARYPSKGSPVLVEGKLQLDEWTSKDGEKKSKMRVRADRVEFLSGGKPSVQQEVEPAAPRGDNPSHSAPAAPPADLRKLPAEAEEEDDGDVPF